MAKDYRAVRTQRKLERNKRKSQHAAEKILKEEYKKPWTKPEPITAASPKQEVYLRLLKKKDQIISMGLAGTGKTYVASAFAGDKLAAGEIEKIVLSRPAIGVDEEHGFLPGDINSKIAPWVRPFTDVFEQRLGPEKYKQAMARKQIEVIPIAYMRGLTLDNAIVILDEAQNCTYNQLKMFLTRIGKNSKVIINGDIKQTDLTSGSGLAIIIKMIKELGIPVDIIEFTKEDIVRSGICQLWAESFEIWEDKYGQSA